MNTFQQPVTKSIHELPPLFQGAELLESLLTEFAHDCKFQDESFCQTWGNEEIVFPASCWDKVFDLMKREAHLITATKRGHVHLVNIQEKEDGDDVNAVTLAAGYLDIQQKIMFYDLPTNQA